MHYMRLFDVGSDYLPFDLEFRRAGQLLSLPLCAHSQPLSHARAFGDCAHGRLPFVPEEQASTDQMLEPGATDRTVR